MRKIYLDNASTTFPKAPGVAQRVSGYIENGCGSVGRGNYESAYSAAEVLLDTRERLCALFGFDDPRNVAFTQNITMALNLVLKGLLKPGDHVLVSSMEHNAVMRPIIQLAEQGVQFDRIPCDDSGTLCLEAIESLVTPGTKAVMLTHASNVCGTVMPIAAVGAICRRLGLLFLVDCAQTAGVCPIDMRGMNIDALCFTGHKGLLAPQGIGGLLASEAVASRLTPLISGGTGSFSDSEQIPPLWPDRMEAGTPNLPGIYGLNEALRYLEAYGIDRIREEEQRLTKQFLSALTGLDGVRLVGVGDEKRQTAVISLDFTGRDNAEIAYRLDSEFGIMTRCGLHCAPNAHKTLGTFPQGTVRFSMSHSNTEDEISETAECIRKILRG